MSIWCPSACGDGQKLNTDLTFLLIFQVVNGLLDLSLDLLGFAGAGGTPHSLLSSKLMKQATC